MSPRGGEPDPADAGAQGVRHPVGMRTRHLSVNITAYENGSYALAYVETSYERGRPRGRKVIARRVADRGTVVIEALKGVEAMVKAEDERRTHEAHLQELEEGMRGGFVSS